MIVIDGVSVKRSVRIDDFAVTITACDTVVGDVAMRWIRRKDEADVTETKEWRVER